MLSISLHVVSTAKQSQLMHNIIVYLFIYLFIFVHLLPDMSHNTNLGITSTTDAKLKTAP
jgi:hypothetical protein